MLFWTVAAALAGDPAGYVTWKAEAATFRVHPPAGEHVALDAPADLSIRVGSRTVSIEAMGADIESGFAIGDVRGQELQARVALSLCEDGGTRCRFVDVTMAGVAAAAKRGSASLEVVANDAAAPEEPHAFPSRIDADDVWDRASAAAAAADKPVLLDFGAVWCPPCNLLSAQVLHADPEPSVVGGFVLAELDVDDASSWPLKDRYDVGGYPTLIAVSADGEELGRLVGYPGPDKTVQWMDDVLTGQVLRPSDAPSARDAAELAWQAVRTERTEDARRYLDLAVTMPDQVPYRLARFALEPSVADAVWLSERAPGHAIDWVPRAMNRYEVEIRDAVYAAIDVDLPTTDPSTAADLLWVRAHFADDAAPSIYGAAAALVRTQLTGDPLQDKGLYGWLSHLSEKAGNTEEATRLLEAARDAFPGEPTFHTSLARLYLDRGMYEEALAESVRGFEVSWGDNRITAAEVRTRALLALGRDAEARGLVMEVLEALPVPEEDVDVRTHRMRERLIRLVAVDE
jgi:thioredoxin-like negative regulator of GroEL